MLVLGKVPPHFLFEEVESEAVAPSNFQIGIRSAAAIEQGIHGLDRPLLVEDYAITKTPRLIKDHTRLVQKLGDRERFRVGQTVRLTQGDECLELDETLVHPAQLFANLNPLQR